MYHRRRRRGHDARRSTVGARGANYGWPACEGACGAAGMTNPIHTYAHIDHDASITGGFVYRGTQFPAEYRGDYFFADYAQNWIKRLTFDANGNVTAVRNFEPPNGALDGPYGDIVALAEGPDGSLWYVDAGPFESNNAGAVRRIRNVERQPAADRRRSAGTPTAARRRSAVAFIERRARPTPRASRSPTAGTSATARPRRRPTRRTRYAASGRYTVRLTTSDGTLETVLRAARRSPSARRRCRAILAPADGRTFRAGDVDRLLRRRHRRRGRRAGRQPRCRGRSSSTTTATSTRCWTPRPAVRARCTIPTSGHSFQGDTNYELVLTATDSDGIQASRSVTIRPAEGHADARHGARPDSTVNVDGVSATAPFATTSWSASATRSTRRRRSPAATRSRRGRTAARKAHTVTVPATDHDAHRHVHRPAARRLVAAYGFDEGTGTTLSDASGHGPPGTLTGPTWSAAGRTGGALSFDGVNDSVRIADHADLDLTTGMTLEAWVKPERARHDWRTVLFKEQPGHMTYALYANNSDRPPAGQVYVGGQRDARGTARARRRTPGRTWPRPTTAATLRLYVNGTQVGDARADRADDGLHRPAQARRQRDLGRVVRGPDRRRARLQPRAAGSRDPERHERAAP